MRIALDTETFESSLPDVAARLISGMNLADMGSQQPLHKATDVGCLVGSDTHMKMIGHQAKGKNLNGMALLGLCDQLDERPIVCIREEDFLSGIAAVEDMKRAMGKYPSENSRHFDLPSC